MCSRDAKLFPLFLWLGIMMAVGCAGGYNHPQSPTPPSEVPYEPDSIMGSASQHILWGMWRLAYDSNTREVFPIPIRNQVVHFDITQMIAPPACDDCLTISVLEFKPVKKYIKLKIAVRNPSQLTGYDVRGIALSSVDGFLLVNADSYTDLWDDGGAVSINPFKAFATDQPNRAIAPGTAHAKIYEIDYPTFADLLDTNIIIDASWPGNCKEPYEIGDFLQDNSILSEGGSTNIQLSIYDWQYNAQDVYLDATPVGGGIVELEYGQGYEWNGTIETSQYNPPGDYRLLVSASSAGTTLKLFNYIDLDVVACSPEGNEIWQNASDLSAGSDSGEQVVCIEDEYDWYRIDVETQLTGELRLTLSNDTGLCSLGFYDNPVGEPIGLSEAGFDADGVIDITPLNIGPGICYARVGFIGSDIEARDYTFFSNTLDSPCYPDGNDSYTGAVDVPNGYMSGIQYVCMEDIEDWFSFSSDESLSGQIALEILNGTGPARITLYNEAQAPTPSGPNLSSIETSTTAYISIEGLPPGTYYVRIDFIGSDSYFREFIFSNNREPGWARTWGTTSDNYAYAVTSDANGDILAVSIFKGVIDLDPGTGVDMHSSGDRCSGAISKFNSVGEYLWGISWGEWSGGAFAYDIALDTTGNIYVTGLLYGTTDLDPGPGVDEHTSNGIADHYLTKFDPEGIYQWALQWGGYDDYVAEHSYGVAVDGFNNIYVVGDYIGECDFDPGPGEDIHISTNSYGGQPTFDAFLVSFTTAGDLRWARTWGGNAKGAFGEEWEDAGRDVICGPTDYIYVVGSFNNTVDFDPGAESVEHFAGDADQTFLSKFDSSGDFVWVKVWGDPSQEDYGMGLAINPDEYIYASGFYRGSIDLDPGPGIDEHPSNGDTDIFLTKFDLDGNFTWGHTWGDEGTDANWGAIDVAASSDIFITGSFQSNTIDLDPGPDIDEHTSGANTNFYLVRLDSDGAYKWGRSWGGNPILQDTNVALDIEVCGNGVSYISGGFEDTVDFDPGPGVDEHSTDGSRNAFLCKMAGDGYF